MAGRQGRRREGPLAGAWGSPARGRRGHDLGAGRNTGPGTVSRIPSGHFGLAAVGQPSPSSGLVAALDEALEAPLLAPAPQLTFLRLELHGAPNRWDPAPPSKPPAFTVDTSLTQKGSFGIADGVWNRVGFQSSRVDLAERRAHHGLRRPGAPGPAVARTPSTGTHRARFHHRLSTSASSRPASGWRARDGSMDSDTDRSIHASSGSRART